AGATAALSPATGRDALPTMAALPLRQTGALHPMTAQVHIAGEASAPTPLAGPAELLTVAARVGRTGLWETVGALLARTPPEDVAGPPPPAGPLSGSARLPAVATKARWLRARVCSATGGVPSRRLGRAIACSPRYCPQDGTVGWGRQGGHSRRILGDVPCICRAPAPALAPLREHVGSSRAGSP